MTVAGRYALNTPIIIAAAETPSSNLFSPKHSSFSTAKTFQERLPVVSDESKQQPKGDIAADDDEQKMLLDKGLAVYLEVKVPKIGRTLARRIVEHIGEQARDVFVSTNKDKNNTVGGHQQEQQLQEVKGISKGLAKDILDHFQNCVDRNLLDVMTRLVPFGISSTICKNIADKYGETATNVIDTNPYTLYYEGKDDSFVSYKGVKGVSFQLADAIALSNPKFARDHPKRIHTGIFYLLSQKAKDGHTAENLGCLLAETLKMLNLGGAEHGALVETLVRGSNVDNVELGSFSGRDYVQLQKYAQDETDIAEFLKRPRSKRSQSRPNQKALQKAALMCGFATFSETQIEAINTVAENGVVVVTGGPGCGKSAIIPALLSTLYCGDSVYCDKVEVVAPTGKAARRLQEIIQGVSRNVHSNLGYAPKPQTIHRLLIRSKTLSCRCVIVDEASMVDTELAAQLIRALPDGCDLVIVGDPDQLPSVGPGTFLQDIINSNVVPVVHLETPFRQAPDSAIIGLAHEVNKGKFPDVTKLAPHNQVEFISCQDQELSTAEIIFNLSEQYDRTEIQILAPMRKGASGINVINTFFQEKNPATQPTLCKFKKGDKVIQTKNNYDLDLLNGMVGSVDHVEENLSASNAIYTTITVSFDDGNIHDFGVEELSDLDLAYAISIHKSQGSEYPVVIIVLSMDHWKMLNRPLLYTALTRGKRKVIIVGDAEACKMAAKNNFSNKRCTLLRERLVRLV